MDFGTAIDTDGLFTGLGESGIGDTFGDVLEESVEYLGRGAFLVKDNQEDLRVKKTKYNASATVYLNTQASAGTAGEWDIYIMYVVLPVIG
jgi:hypothetical protein